MNTNGERHGTHLQHRQGLSAMARPKSSPTIRSFVSDVSPSQALPSYQERRLQRHGSIKLSRPTTARLRQEPGAGAKHKVMFKSTKSTSDVWNQDKTTTQSTAVHSQPGERILLRPHTAVQLHRRLRQLAKKRVKSAQPRSDSFASGSEFLGSEYAGSEYAENNIENVHLQQETELRTQNSELEKRAFSAIGAEKTSGNVPESANATAFLEPVRTEKKEADDTIRPPIKVGWNSSKPSDTTEDGTTRSAKGHAFANVSSRFTENIDIFKAESVTRTNEPTKTVNNEQLLQSGTKVTSVTTPSRSLCLPLPSSVPTQSLNSADGSSSSTLQHTGETHSFSQNTLASANQIPSNSSQVISERSFQKPTSPRSSPIHIAVADHERVFKPIASPISSRTSSPQPHIVLPNEVHTGGDTASSSRSTPSDIDSTHRYTSHVPELRLGTAECSIAITPERRLKTPASQASQQRKTSVVAMMKRNRHTRHHRLSMFLQVPTSKKPTLRVSHWNLTLTTATGKRRESALERFRRLSKTIRVIAGICLALKSYVKEGKTKQWSLVEMQLNLKADMEKTLAFDPLMFSNLHVSRGSDKLKIILSKLPRHRTSRDIDVVLALLRKNKTFANYHRDTQAKLAKIMEYQRFEARRIVLKEGHEPSCYYIILSGVCLVNQLDIDRRNNSVFVTTVKEISSGDAFGEVALLTDTVREYSIVCKEEVELLLINKDDFMSIIRIPMENEQKELIKFCVVHEIFTNEMFGNIKSNYKTILAHYYKPGTVISKDLKASEYIYVIKTGNCRVLSEVIEIRKKKKEKQSMTDDSWKKHAALKRSMSLLDGSKVRRAGWASYARKQLYGNNGNTQANSVSSTSKNVRTLTRSDSTVTDNFNAIPASEYLAAHLALQKETKVADKKAVARAWRRVTIAASSASEKERKINEEANSKATMISEGVKTTFAQVADLTSGAVCGMETLLSTLSPDTRLCLVSDGADCILVSKKVFNNSKNTAKTVETANKMGTEYPSCSDQLAKLVQARTWAAYKDKIVHDVMYDRYASRGKVL